MGIWDLPASEKDAVELLQGYGIWKGQTTCLTLIENGYVHTFEEIHNLKNSYKKVREAAEHSLFKTMPKDFSKEPEILKYIEENLKNAEEATRKGSFEINYQTRMNLGKYFHELDGYHWLAIHFYESSQWHGSEISVNAKLAITSLQRQALLEENRGNTDISLKYLKKALKMYVKNSLDQDDPLWKDLNRNLSRIYQQLGEKYLEREKDSTDVHKSISLKYFQKAVQLAKASEDLETQAACYALQGKGMMKFNEDESALKSFELYIELSEKSNDKYGTCQGYFVISNIFKRAGDLNKSVSALNKCQELAKNHCFDIPFIFSAICLGQIETAKRNYLKANEHFEEAYNKTFMSNLDYTKKESLNKLAKVMYGIGKAHLTFHHLVNDLQTPMNLLLPKVLRWRRTGGSFSEKIEEKKYHFTKIDEMEKEDEETQLSVIIENLMDHEFHQA